MGFDLREGMNHPNSCLCPSVLNLCSVRELSRAQNENWRTLYRQNEVQETQCSLFPIYPRLPKLDVNPLVGSLAGSGTINAVAFAEPLGLSVSRTVASGSVTTSRSDRPSAQSVRVGLFQEQWQAGRIFSLTSGREPRFALRHQHRHFQLL